MNNTSIGIFAHVDAGKTTLSERLLFLGGALRAVGRVDAGSTSLDTDPIERSRGITVYSDQSEFIWKNRRFTLIDTPGHVDFAPEAERAMLALDAAVLLVDLTDGVRAHTAALARLLRARHIPTVVFLNKRDLPAADIDKTMQALRDRLEGAVVPLPADAETVAELDEAFLEQYLSEDYTDADVTRALSRAFLDGSALPVLTGAALSGDGAEALLDALCALCPEPVSRDDAPAEAVVYKVRRDTKGQRVTFIRMTKGVLRAREAFRFGETVEKVNELRIYHGASYTTTDALRAGDTAGVLGLSIPKCGDRLVNGTLVSGEGFSTVPALAAGVTATDGTSDDTLLEKLRILEDEEVQLRVTHDPATRELLVRIMGRMQLEILTEVMKTRFHISVEFTKPKVVYLETVHAPVMGCGHYEPLRHYAEAILRLEPLPRGTGIEFESRCHVDTLPLSFQSGIRANVFERVHRGVLTGAPLTDVRIVLLAGRHHLKHTEGGDFREAVYRAIRQGLMKAESVLLEPCYAFEILVPETASGRVMSDLIARSATFDPPVPLGKAMLITGRGPVESLMDYPAELLSFTHGEGSASFRADGCDVCHNTEEVVAQAGYDPLADREQPPSSVFCAHGAGFLVPWDEADAHMHCLPLPD